MGTVSRPGAPVRQPRGQIAPAVQEIDNDHAVGLIHEHDQMLAAASEAQILGQARIDDLGAALPRRLVPRDCRAAVDQVGFIGLGLSRTEGFKGPERDVDERCSGCPRQPPGLAAH